MAVSLSPPEDMLRVLTGSFHPDLEQALGEEIGRLKAADPFAPIALVVPSSGLAAHLRQVLAVEQQRNLLHVHVLTFHQLALRLYEEHGADLEHGMPVRRFESRPDFFFEHLIGYLVRRELDALHPLRSAAVGPGTWAVLWRTIRDLQDAAVDPAVALRAVEEGVFAVEDSAGLSALFTLQAAFGESCRALGVGLLDDLASAVVPWVPSSRFLNGLTRVCYYGFYDLTQVQLGLFESVAEHVPVTLFFPLRAGPAFAFAQRFFERHVTPLTTSAGDVLRVAPDQSDRPVGFRRHPAEIMSAVGPEDELVAAARQILMLVETQGYRFDQIGVVARGLEPYQGALRRVFDDHRIPFSSSAVSPLLHEPTVKTLVQLASLPVVDFYREPVLDVVTSPLYALDRVEVSGTEPRPDQWRLAVRILGIMRGDTEWRKLARAGDVEEWGAQAEEDGEASPVGSVDSRQVALLWTVVQALLSDVRGLPRVGGYAELTDAFVAVAVRHLRIPALAPGWREEDEADPRRRLVGEAIRSSLAAVAQLEVLGESVPYESWLVALMRALERGGVPLVAPDGAGVQVVDAMAARGLTFEALLVLGLNEKTFPRYIHEDPFLHDRHRRVLDETLGYKIDEKLGAYDEENLLFALLASSARARLYLIYQRADEEGRPLAPSPYLLDLIEEGVQETRLPRRLADRDGAPLCAPLISSAGELILRAVLNGEEVTPLVAACGRDALLVRHGRQALEHLEASGLRLGPHDGLTGALERHWEHLAARGLAPTSMERYATCPYRYFAAQVLRLEGVRQQVPEELPPHAWGTLIHAVLRACYQDVIDRGWPEADLGEEELRDVVEAGSSRVYAEYERHHGTGHALIWDMVRKRIGEVVRAAARADREDFLRTGFKPVAFEVEASGPLDGVLGDAYAGLRVRGRVDRIDRRTDPPGVRVVDYKYKQGRELTPRDNDLLTGAVRGRSLQPPLYALVETHVATPPDGGARPERVEFLFLLPRSARVVERAAFHASAWEGGVGRRLGAAVRHLMEGIREGRFFIMPDGYCEHCEFSAMCRRAHGPTWTRAYRSAPARALRGLRRQKAADGPGHADS